MVVGWDTEYFSYPSLVMDGCRATDDSQVPRGKHHVLRYASDIENDGQWSIRCVGIGCNQCSCHCRARQVPCEWPDLREIDQPLAVADDNERPALQIFGAARAPASMEDSLDLNVVDGAI